MTLNNSRTGSAWHDWQRKGEAWRVDNPEGNMIDAALKFAEATDLPDLSHYPRAVAFAQGAARNRLELDAATDCLRMQHYRDM